jgi:hypothetical protein
MAPPTATDYFKRKAIVRLRLTAVNHERKKNSANTHHYWWASQRKNYENAKN